MKRGLPTQHSLIIQGTSDASAAAKDG